MKIDPLVVFSVSFLSFFWGCVRVGPDFRGNPAINHVLSTTRLVREWKLSPGTIETVKGSGITSFSTCVVVTGQGARDRQHWLTHDSNPADCSEQDSFDPVADSLQDLLPVRGLLVAGEQQLIFLAGAGSGGAASWVLEGLEVLFLVHAYKWEITDTIGTSFIDHTLEPRFINLNRSKNLRWKPNQSCCFFWKKERTVACKLRQICT